MKHAVSFLRRAFPPRKQAIIKGGGFGVGLVAATWYPLPMLLKKIDFPRWSLYLLLALLIVLVCWQFFTGKLFRKRLDEIGWTVVGYFAAGLVLSIFFHELLSPILVASAGMLGLYLFLLRANPEE